MSLITVMGILSFIVGLAIVGRNLRTTTYLQNRELELVMYLGFVTILTSVVIHSTIVSIAPLLFMGVKSGMSQEHSCYRTGTMAGWMQLGISAICLLTVFILCTP